MKRLLFLLMCLPSLINAQEAKARPNGPSEWHGRAGEGGRGIKFVEAASWRGVLEKAKAENKYIFLDAYTTWCAPCKQMDKEVYPDERVGRFMNDKFISVKLQMDSTGKDNEHVKRWYAETRALDREYKIGAYPTFLFFNSGGTLIYRDIGYKSVPDFIQLAQRAVDPQNLLYYPLLEDYKKGKKEMSRLFELSLFVSNTIGDDTLAQKIARDYTAHVPRQELLNPEKIMYVIQTARDRQLAERLVKEYNDDYLNHLSEEEFCTRDNVGLFNGFSHLITSKDKIFQLSYEKPEKIDSASGFTTLKFAEGLVHWTIIREELQTRLFKDEKPVVKNPDWKKLQSLIKTKYPKVNAKELILNYQRYYYSELDKDCAQWAKYHNEHIMSLQFDPEVMNKLGEFNDLGAWHAFMNCTEETVLTKALEWIDRAIQLAGPEAISYLHTRANLLYKLGRVKEAISQEEKAIAIGLEMPNKREVNLQSLLHAVNRYKATLEKMKKGEPTFVERGAVWDAKTLQKIRGKKAVK